MSSIPEIPEDFPGEEYLRKDRITLIRERDALHARVAELEADLRWVIAYVDAITEGEPADAHDDDARWARVRAI